MAFTVNVMLMLLAFYTVTGPGYDKNCLQVQ